MTTDFAKPGESIVNTTSGFSCKTAIKSDANTVEEIYESTCSDEELSKRTDKIYSIVDTRIKHN